MALIGYSAMAGAVGGGGLGNLAISYGEHRNMVYVKWIATVIIVAIVMVSQKLGDHWRRNMIIAKIKLNTTSLRGIL